MSAQHTRQSLMAARPSTPDEVDQWLATYMACVERARAEEAARERLNDAAPDMLAALQCALAAWDRLYPLMPVSAMYEDCEFREMQAVRAAIAKATEESPHA